MSGRPNTTGDPPPPSASGGGRPRPILVAALAISALAIAAGLAITLGGLSGPNGTASSPGSSATEPGATPAYADLSLVPVVATESPTLASIPAGSTSVPVSVQPTTSASPAVAHGIQANRIRIERLAIDLKIIEGDGIDAPIGKAAHYPGSAWPGSGSNIYIYGHAREGMFLNLWNARVGDAVELDLVDGTTRTYLVDQVIPKVPWDAVKYTRPTATEQLTLQTSTSYHPTSPRFIVIAHPAP